MELNADHLDPKQLVQSITDGASRLPDGAQLVVINAGVQGADLDGVDWSEIRFEKCDFSGIGLRKATLIDTEWYECDMRRVDFTGAHLQRAKFLNRTQLEGAQFSDADLTRAEFSDCSLIDAVFVGCHLDHVQLGGLRLTGVDLTRATLGGADAYRLDSTIVQNTEFPVEASDPWSVLRRTYTGHKFVLNFTALCVFIFSLVLKAYSAQLAALLQSAPALSQGIEAYCQQHGCREVSLVSVLLGVHDGFWTATFVICALLYNFCRLVLTLEVSALREQEDRSARTPAFKAAERKSSSDSIAERLKFWFTERRHAYDWLYHVHRRWMSWFRVVVLISFIPAAVTFLGSTIAIPTEHPVGNVARAEDT